MSTLAVNILVVGACGRRAEQNIFPALLNLQDRAITLRLVGVCDRIPPAERADHKYLQAAIRAHRPTFVPAQREFAATATSLERLAHEHHIHLIILTADPTCHMEYASWAIRKGISILCEKPPHSVKHASFDANCAARIHREYVELMSIYDQMKRRHPNLRFNIDLGRRNWRPVRDMLDFFKKIEAQTNQGLTYLNVVINNGVHRFPNELLNDDAHGYTTGLGLLSHSAYHYIDLAAHLLGRFRGRIASFELTLGYVQRVRDYIHSSAYRGLQELVGDASAISPQNELPLPVLSAELGVHFFITLRDIHNNVIGVCTFSSHNSTFTPRTRPSRADGGNLDNEGMRTARLICEAHIGPFGSFQLIQNDVIGESFALNVHKQANPFTGLSLDASRSTFNGDMEIKALSDVDLLCAYAKQAIGLPGDADAVFVEADAHCDTVALYSGMYQLLALNFAGLQGGIPIVLNDKRERDL